MAQDSSFLGRSAWALLFLFRSSAARGDSAGSSVGGVGDVNDDGVDDIFLGGYEAGIGGEIYVLFGGAP
jgi:hypothetical protein